MSLTLRNRWGSPVDAEIRVSGDEVFERILRERLVEPVFQPVVALADGRPVGFEALARGPEGRFHAAAELFAAAARTGRSAELDRLCASMASRRFREARVPGCALFVNINPDTLAGDAPDELVDAWTELTHEQDVVLEITEQSVLREPRRLMDAVVEARRRRARIALDDVGSEPASLVAMPLINPDIIKLDRSIVQSGSDSWAVSQVVNAVLDQAQRQGAQVLAEGVERPEHVAAARSMGATLAQGWLFGRPGPLSGDVRRSAQRLARVTPRNVALASPFEVLSRTADVVPMSDDLRATMSTHIENQASRTMNPAILAVNLGDEAFTDETKIRYASLAERGIVVLIVGTRIPHSLGGRLRSRRLADDDPLGQERTVLFVGSRYGSGFFARRHPIAGSWLGGTCYDPDRVIEATLALIHRLPVPQRRGLGSVTSGVASDLR